MDCYCELLSQGGAQLMMLDRSPVLAQVHQHHGDRTPGAGSYPPLCSSASFLTRYLPVWCMTRYWRRWYPVRSYDVLGLRATAQQHQHRRAKPRTRTSLASEKAFYLDDTHMQLGSMWWRDFNETLPIKIEQGESDKSVTHYCVTSIDWLGGLAGRDLYQRDASIEYLFPKVLGAHVFARLISRFLLAQSWWQGIFESSKVASRHHCDRKFDQWLLAFSVFFCGSAWCCAGAWRPQPWNHWRIPAISLRDCFGTKGRTKLPLYADHLP